MSNQTTAVAERQKAQVADVRSLLEKMKGQMELALPRHLNADRLARVALSTIQQNPKLLECDRSSLLSAIMSCAQLGLEPDGLLGQAYLVPFKVGGNYRVQFIPGYRGLIDLARRSGDVSSISAMPVYESDDFTIDYSQEPPFTHKPKLKGDRGAIVGFWALARFKDGGTHFEFMTVDEVTGIRDRSQGYMAFKKGFTKSSPWETDFSEMGKKTVVRRLCKYLPMSVARLAAGIEDQTNAGNAVELNRETGDFIVIAGGGDDEAADEPKKPKSGGKLSAFAGDDGVIDDNVTDDPQGVGKQQGDEERSPE